MLQLCYRKVSTEDFGHSERLGVTRLSNTKAQKGNARIGVTGSASARSETRAEHV